MNPPLSKPRLLAGLALAGHAAIAATFWITYPPGLRTLALAFVGWAGADLASGFYHLLLDNLPADEHGALLRRQAWHFQIHHRDGLAFLGEGLLAAALPTAAPSLALAVLGVLLYSPLLWAFGLGIYVAQISHGCAHLRSRWARPLQIAGIFLRPADHDHHHRDIGSTFCVLTGWWNPVLDRLVGATPLPAPQEEKP